jgi:hypothetical protein
VRAVVDAPGPVEVALDLCPPSPTGRLTVHALRHEDGSGPRLTDVTLAPPRKDEPWTLRLRVPASQPPGAYAGAIVDDDTAEAVGTVHLRIAAP